MGLIAFWLAWFRQGRKKPWKKGRKSAGKKGLEGACLTKEQQTDNTRHPSGAWGGMTAPQYPFPGRGNRQLRAVLMVAGTLPKKRNFSKLIVDIPRAFWYY